MKKRILCLILSLFFILALFSGCGGTGGTANAGGSSGTNSSTKDTNSQTSDGDNSSSGEPDTEKEPVEESPYKFAGNYAVDEAGYPEDWYNYELPISTTDEVLTMWSHCYAPEFLSAEGFSGELYHQTVENRTGVHIEFILSSWNERQTQFSVMQAGGDMPDIVTQAGLFIKGSKANNIAEGYFVNLWDYKDYAPNYMYAIKTLSEKQPDVRDACIVAPETIFEFVALYDTATPSLAQLGIRYDWVEKLGLSMEDIQTVDQLHDVLQAFKVEFNCDFPWWMCDAVDNGGWFACYDVNTVLDNVYQSYFPGASLDAEGKVHFYYSDDNAKSLVTQLSSWIAEGFVCPNWIDPLGGMGDSEIFNSQVGTYSVLASTLSSMNAKTEDPDANWQILPRTTLYKGQVLHLGDDKSYYSTFNSGTSVNAECENIALAVTWLDWRYSPEGAFLGSYGVENEMWSYNEEGEIRRGEELLADPTYMWLTQIRCANYMCEHGYRLTAAQFAYDGGPELLEKTLSYYDTYTCDHAYQWPVGATLTDEESTEFMSAGSGDLVTYIQEQIIMFCTGDRPMSEWDSYIETLNTLGLQECIAVYQGCYERYLTSRA